MGGVGGSSRGVGADREMSPQSHQLLLWSLMPAGADCGLVSQYTPRERGVIGGPAAIGCFDFVTSEVGVKKKSGNSFLGADFADTANSVPSLSLEQASQRASEPASEGPGLELTAACPLPTQTDSLLGIFQFATINSSRKQLPGRCAEGLKFEAFVALRRGGTL